MILMQSGADHITPEVWQAGGNVWNSAPQNAGTGATYALTGSQGFGSYASWMRKIFSVTSASFWLHLNIRYAIDVNYSAPEHIIIGDSTKPHFGFWIGGGAAGARLFRAGRCSNAGWVGSGFTLGAELGTPTFALSHGTWYDIQIEGTVDDSAGVIKTWINSVADIDVSGVDTRNGGDAYANTFQIGASDYEFNAFDNLVFGNNLTINTGHLGEVRVDCMWPNANGTDRANGGSGEMTRSTGADDYTLLDDATMNTTDYVYADVSGERCSVNLQALTNAGGTIAAVKGSAYATKNDGGACKFKMYLLIGGTRYYSDEYVPSWGSWRLYQYIWNTNPATSGAWDETAFNSAEIGVERTA